MEHGATSQSWPCRESIFGSLSKWETLTQPDLAENVCLMTICTTNTMASTPRFELCSLSHSTHVWWQALASTSKFGDLKMGTIDIFTARPWLIKNAWLVTISKSFWHQQFLMFNQFIYLKESILASSCEFCISFSPLQSWCQVSRFHNCWGWRLIWWLIRFTSFLPLFLAVDSRRVGPVYHQKRYKVILGDTTALYNL